MPKAPKKTKDKRKTCPHCLQNLNNRTFAEHRRKYFDQTTQLWRSTASSVKPSCTMKANQNPFMTKVVLVGTNNVYSTLLCLCPMARLAKSKLKTRCQSARFSLRASYVQIGPIG